MKKIRDADILLFVFGAMIITVIALCFLPILLIIGFVYGLWKLFYIIYESCYFGSEAFRNIKGEITEYIQDCNELNEHIEDLKKSYANLKHDDYGVASYDDNSIYNYQRKELEKLSNSPNVYNCSLSVCKSAQQQPLKYLCKYFNIIPNEQTLINFEKVLNDFASAEQGKQLLKSKKEKILNSINGKIPFLIRKFNKGRLDSALGFEKFDFNTIYFPTYSFVYISPGGNSSMKTVITFDVDNLNKFVVYLSELIKFKASIIGQRALMTSSLREKIKERDKFTCKNCGNSIEKEPNLLLEIDHIIPLSKGGITSEDNLQTLCWKCNRSKGAKMTISEEVRIND